MIAGVPVAIAAGSNLGDRMAHLRAGVRALAEVVRLEAISDVVESPSEQDPGQSDYLNLVVRARTDMDPGMLLRELLAIERAHGRVRREGSGEARTLDLDLILHSDSLRNEPGLQVPHPRWSQRAFVARPLLQVFPDASDPETGRLLSECLTERARTGPLRRKGRIELPDSAEAGATPS